MKEYTEQNNKKEELLREAKNIWEKPIEHFEFLKLNWDDLDEQQRKNEINLIHELCDKALEKFLALGFNQVEEKITIENFKKEVDTFVKSKL